MDVHASTVSTLHLCCISVDRCLMVMVRVMVVVIVMLMELCTTQCGRKRARQTHVDIFMLFVPTDHYEA